MNEAIEKLRKLYRKKISWYNGVRQRNVTYYTSIETGNTLEAICFAVALVLGATLWVLALAWANTI